MVAGKIITVLLVFFVLSFAVDVLSDDEDHGLIAGRSHGKRVHVEDASLDFDKEICKWLRTLFNDEFVYAVVEFFLYMGFFISYMAFFWFCCFSRCVKSNRKCPECPGAKNIAELPA